MQNKQLAKFSNRGGALLPAGSQIDETRREKKKNE